MLGVVKLLFESGCNEICKENRILLVGSQPIRNREGKGDQAHLCRALENKANYHCRLIVKSQEIHFNTLLVKISNKLFRDIVLK